jgi:hypothetical protein
LNFRCVEDPLQTGYIPNSALNNIADELYQALSNDTESNLKTKRKRRDYKPRRFQGKANANLSDLLNTAQ